MAHGGQLSMTEGQQGQPLHPRPAPGRADQGASDEETRIEELRERFHSLVTGRARWEDVYAAADEYFTAKVAAEAANAQNTGPVAYAGQHKIAEDLREVKEGLARLEKAIHPGKGPQPRTYAGVLAHGVPSALPERAHVVPKKARRELLVSTPGLDPAKTTPEKVVHQINVALRETTNGAIEGARAARILAKSHDIAVTFEEDKFGWYNSPANEEWVKILGPGAQLRRKTYAVLAKRVRYEKVAGCDEDLDKRDKLARKLNEANGVTIARLRLRGPRGRPASEADLPPRTVQLLLEFHSVEDAIKICDLGTLLDYECHPSGRFEGDATATQCFNCGKWGHKAKFCAEKTRCLLCGGAAHGNAATAREREENCPVKRCPETHGPKCLNCGGRHPRLPPVLSDGDRRTPDGP
ncbi:hypothetical protein N7535_005468 [Penicillium sp. DV-2018c]|nr:hypothetical protein N7535_005468 [Penicillium sp. DV-2018c]